MKITFEQAAKEASKSVDRKDRLSILKELQTEGFKNYQAEFDKSKDLLKKK